MSPEQLAELTLATYSQAQGPPVDIISIVRTAGIQLYEWPFADNRIGGAFRWVDGVPVIIVNGRHAWARKRFSIAHEFCHYMVDMPSPRSAGTLLHRGRLPHCERTANKYAAALLMPADLVCGLHKRGVPVDAMCTVMGVSKQAMNIRLDELRREGRL
jgi:Zn-dependent peptidase ImmA (M78 family)